MLVFNTVYFFRRRSPAGVVAQAIKYFIDYWCGQSGNFQTKLYGEEEIRKN